MLSSDDRTSPSDGWRFHAPIPSGLGAPAARSAKPAASTAASRGVNPRYSRSLAQRIKALKDGGVARFQVGDSCFMALRIGSELFIRPFGEDSSICVNGAPVTEMTRITYDDCLQIGGRTLLLRPPRQPETPRDDSVDKLLEMPDEPTDAAVAERERQTRVGYRDPSRPPEAWGE